MSGTELSRVRTELRLLLREHINQRLLVSRAADIVMQSSAQKQLFVGIQNWEFRANSINHLRPGLKWGFWATSGPVEVLGVLLGVRATQSVQRRLADGNADGIGGLLRTEAVQRLHTVPVEDGAGANGVCPGKCPYLTGRGYGLSLHATS
jgi:hypothetical protein